MIPHPDEYRDEQAGPGDVVAGSARAFRGWILALVVIAAFVAFLLWGAGRVDPPRFVDDTGGASVTPATPADGLVFEAIDRLVGDSCLELLVADSQRKRTSGLRGRESELERVDGMLFVFDEPVDGLGFTMAGVVDPLEIGFYDREGRNVGGHVMEPCDGSLIECPLYHSPSPYLYAIETAPGQLPDGDLGGACEPDTEAARPRDGPVAVDAGALVLVTPPL